MAALEIFSTPLFSDANLVSYWRMEGNANDSKDSNNGTSGSITYSSGNGKFGQGAGFNGTSSSIIIGKPSNLNITGNITVTAWASITNYTITRNIVSRLLYDVSGSNNHQGYTLQMSSGGYLIWWNGNGYVQTLGTTYVGNWVHLAGVTDNSNMILYINGTQAAIDIKGTQLSQTTYNTYIGKSDQASSEWFFGNIDDVAIFNKALSNSDIYNLYSGSWYAKKYRTLLGVGA